MKITEIADKAGVSKTTVSLVINGRGEAYRISKKTQQKILEIVRDNNFVPDWYARGLRLKNNQTIGLVVPDLRNWFFSQISYEIESLSRERGYQLFIGCSDDNEETEFKVINNLYAKRIDGLIIASVMKKDQITKDILDLDIPVVYIDRRIESQNISWVASDNRQGAYDLINYMCKAGSRRIGYLGGMQHISTSKNRLRGYRDALETNCITFDSSIVYVKDYTILSGYTLTEQLFEENSTMVDGLFTTSLTLLEGALQYINNNKEHIPEILRIGTYDDHPFLDYFSIKIPSVRQNTGKVAQTAFEMISDMLTGKKVVKHEVITSKLIIRE